MRNDSQKDAGITKRSLCRFELSASASSVRIALSAGLGILVGVGVAYLGLSPSHDPSNAMLVQEASQGRAVYIRTIDLAHAQPPKKALVDEALFKTHHIPGGWVPVLVRGAHSPRQSVVWVSPNHHYLMVGAVFDRAGLNLTREVSQAEHVVVTSGQEGAPTPPVAPSQSGSLSGSLNQVVSGAPRITAPMLGDNLSNAAFWSATHRYTHGIVQYPVKGPHHTLYVYIDPDCSFCHHLFLRLEKLKPLLRQAHLQVKWLPVAILRPGGAKRAQAVLAGGLKALIYNETHFQVAVEKGGIAGKQSIPTTVDLLDNMRIFAASGKQIGTPTLTWKNRGKAHKVIGLPTWSGLRAIIASFHRRTH